MAIKKVFLFWLIIILLTSSFTLVACTTTTQTSTSTPVITTTKSSSTATTSKVTTTSISTSTQANWWDKFGTPKYGGTINVVIGFMGLNLDVYQMVGADVDLWYENLFEPNWIQEREKWPMTGNFFPDEYWSGTLAESWTVDNPTTITVKLREGVTWQNKAPVNGREFVASDVQFHYDRIMGTGSGYIYPSPMFAGSTSTWDRVTATDKYTVVFKFKQASTQNFQSIADRWSLNLFEAPEWVALGGPPVNEAPAGDGGGGGPPSLPPLPSGPLGDWKQVVGTSAWMFTDFISGSNLSFSKNTSYWGNDPRYPQNKTPYADTLNLLIIPDSATRLSALRTGKIDTMNNQLMGLTWQDAEQFFKTNPNAQKVKLIGGADGIGLRVDMKPFTDIRVRKALDMAIDRKVIADGYYGGTATPEPVGMVTRDFIGWAYAYADWPQSLKDEYAYNVEGAKQLLTEAGYPNGFDTNVVVSNDANLIQLMQVFQSYFAEIGVNMEIRPMDQAAEQAYTRAGKHDQMSAQGLGAGPPPVRLIDGYYSIGGTDAIYYGLNNAPDKVYDTLHDQFLAATTTDEAQKIFRQMDEEFIKQHIVIGAPTSYKFQVWQPWLGGYSGEGLGWGMGVILARVWTTNK